MSQLSDQKSLNSLPTSTQVNGTQPLTNWLYALWKFSRPHTIIGTSLSVLGLYLIAIADFSTQLTHHSWFPLIGTWVACLCGNIYIVGLNQLEDVEIDQINKPHLPVAAGEFSRREAQVIVAITGMIAILFAFLQGQYLFATVGISLVIGTAYSLPPIRLKRFPFWAAICIFTVRGIIVNLGFFAHYLQTLGGSLAITAPVWALTVFVLGFTFAIAIFKDIPDMEGDRQYNITTFTLKLGAQTVFNLACWVIIACYLSITIVSFWLPGVNAIFISITHLVALAWFGWRSQRVDLQNKSAIADFYQFIWKLFFLEYLMFPVACLLA